MEVSLVAIDIPLKAIRVNAQDQLRSHRHALYSDFSRGVVLLAKKSFYVWITALTGNATDLLVQNAKYVPV